MTLLMLLLLACAVYFLSRLQFLLTAQRDDLADLHGQITALRRELQANNTRSTKPSPKARPLKAPEAAIALGDINSVSKNTLLKIPGVGATCAQRVIDARPLTSLADLDGIPGISNSQRASLKRHLTLS